MIRQTPFHDRTGPANTTQLWTHWAGCLVASKYQLSEKSEYYAFRNSAGLFDTSPLYKYRFSGPDAERFLAGLLVRDPRACRVGQAHYTLWCDDRGFVLEDGVLVRLAPSEFLLTAAEPNLFYFTSLADGYDVAIEDVSQEMGALAVQGPRSRAIISTLAPEVGSLPFFRVIEAKIGDAAVVVSRTGFTGDLGYEIWVDADDAIAVWDSLMDTGAPHGLIPVGLEALKMARIEAGLLLLDTDFASSRFAFNDAHRSTPFELGLGWMLRSLYDERQFIGRDALRRERDTGTSRWAMTGLVVDWADYDARFESAGLVPPKDHRPLTEEAMVYDKTGERVGYATSAMYSPILQRHIALTRVRPELTEPGTRLYLEFTIDHVYEKITALVTRLPFFDPPRKIGNP